MRHYFRHAHFLSHNQNQIACNYIHTGKTSGFQTPLACMQYCIKYTMAIIQPQWANPRNNRNRHFHGKVATATEQQCKFWVLCQTANWLRPGPVQIFTSFTLKQIFIKCTVQVRTKFRTWSQHSDSANNRVCCMESKSTVTCINLANKPVSVIKTLTPM